MGKMGWEGGGDELGGGRRRMKWVVVVGRGLPPFLDLENWLAISAQFCGAPKYMRHRIMQKWPTQLLDTGPTTFLWRMKHGAPQNVFF
jgi:hypothetical protein